MREKILKVAEEQMRKAGYMGLSFSKISSQLGTTRANLHYHFKNKISLAEEVTKSFILERETDVKKIALRYPDDIVSFIIEVEKYFWNFIEENGTNICLCSQLVSNTSNPQEIVDLAVKHFEELSALLMEIAVASQKVGKIPQTLDLNTFVIQTTAMIMGLAQMVKLTTDMKTAKKSWGHIMKKWVKSQVES